MMNEAIDSSHSHHAIREDMIPATKRLIGRDNQTTTLIAVSDELEQELGFGVSFLHVADVIDNDHPLFVQLGHYLHQLQVLPGLL